MKTRTHKLQEERLSISDGKGEYVYFNITFGELGGQGKKRRKFNSGKVTAWRKKESTISQFIRSKNAGVQTTVKKKEQTSNIPTVKWL